jgi:hypothetical protein
MQTSRFIVGLVLITIAILIFLFAEGDYSTPAVIAVSMLGLVLVAISRRKPAR